VCWATGGEDDTHGGQVRVPDDADVLSGPGSECCTNGSPDWRRTVAGRGPDPVPGTVAPVEHRWRSASST
jgi:hypothetical protein